MSYSRFMILAVAAVVASVAQAGTIHVDKDACPPLSSCCFDTGSPGCDDAECEAAVCAIDPFCCIINWDGPCAGLAQDLCDVLCAFECPGSGSGTEGDPF